MSRTRGANLALRERTRVVERVREPSKYRNRAPTPGPIKGPDLSRRERFFLTAPAGRGETLLVVHFSFPRSRTHPTFNLRGRPLELCLIRVGVCGSHGGCQSVCSSN